MNERCGYPKNLSYIYGVNEAGTQVKLKIKVMLQLDLFEGVVLSEKQTELLIKFQTDNTRKVKIAHGRNINTANALIEGGFVEGVDFENTFDVIECVEGVELGYSFNNTLFTVNDVKFIKTTGGLTLNSKKYSKTKNEVVDTKINYVGFENGKFDCSNLVGSYRSVKASTLLTKLQDQRERAEYDFKQANKKKAAFAKVIAELQTKCPDARILEVTESIKYDNRYSTIEKVKAQFENGSYIMFAVRVSDATYSLDRKYDAGLACMSVDELLVNFTNQNK